MIASSFWQRKISGCNEHRSNRRVYETLTIAPPPYYISLPMSVCRHSIDSGMDAFPIGPIVRSRVYIISLQMNLRSSPPRQWRNLLHSSSSLRPPSYATTNYVTSNRIGLIKRFIEFDDIFDI